MQRLEASQTIVDLRFRFALLKYRSNLFLLFGAKFALREVYVERYKQRADLFVVLVVHHAFVWFAHFAAAPGDFLALDVHQMAVQMLDVHLDSTHITQYELSVRAIKTLHRLF